MICNHSSWLDISDDGPSRHVKHSSRLRNLVSSLPSPTIQYPNLALVVESSETKFFPANERSGVYLRLDPDTTCKKNPLLIANTQSFHSLRPPRRGPHGYRCCSWLHEGSLPRLQADIALSSIVLPFVDVLCFLCMSQGDIRNAEAQINTWCSAWAENHIELSKPRFVLLLANSHLTKPSSVQQDLIRRFKFLKNRVSVIRIGQASWASQGVKAISDRLLHAISRSQKERERRKFSFSAYHFQELFEHSFARQMENQPFRYVQAARTFHPLAPNLSGHISNFINQLPDDCDEQFVAETLASAFLFDHLTPEMHDFHIQDVFDQLYAGTCRALYSLRGFPSAELIVRGMEALHTAKNARKYSIVQVHEAVMKKYQDTWKAIDGNHATCLSCLRRRPEYKLPCRHLLCRHCVRQFADRHSNNPYKLSLTHCCMCRTRCNLYVLDRPPTAGFGLLSLDGGGVRGIVQTVILTLLEQRIDLPIPIQEYFQLAGGVSAGGLNIIGLFLKGWSASECTQKYKQLVRGIFQRKLWHRIPVLSMLLTICDNAIYPAKAIEQAIEDAYGSEANMLDPSQASASGTRIILPVATTPDPSLLLFTNYNGVGDWLSRIGYRVHKEAGDVAVSDVARSCTAAPVFFSPKLIPEAWVPSKDAAEPLAADSAEGWSTNATPYEDAGAIENNISSIVYSEHMACHGSDAACQFILNIGTGSRPLFRVREAVAGVMATAIETVRASALNRVIAAYNWLLSGPSYWDRQMRSTDRASGMLERCVRLDIEFDGSEPRLDDVESMEGLIRKVYNDASLAKAIDSMARRLIASLFYFELDQTPRHTGGLFSGSGSLLCLRKQGDPGLPLLVNKIISQGARFFLNKSIIGIDLMTASYWDQVGNFILPVQFHLPTAEFTITLRWERQEFPISGCAPQFSLRDLERKQRLDCHFGPSYPRHANIISQRDNVHSAPKPVNARPKKRMGGTSPTRSAKRQKTEGYN